jgi:hypothetical protein
MRLKIIALICLLTIAVPVEADAPRIPPIPGDTADPEAVRQFITGITEDYYLCVEPIGLPTSHDNMAAIQAFTSTLTKDIADRHESVLQIRIFDSTLKASGIQFTIIWNTDEVVLCKL